MRNILVKITNAKLKPYFKVEEMPSLGRIDIAARSVLYGLWKSNDIRKDTNVYIYFGKRDKGIVMVFKGKEIKKLSPNEREIGIYISKAYTIYHKSKEKSKESKDIVYNGVHVYESDFENLVRYLRNKSSLIILLDRSGDFILNEKIKFRDTTIILGDNKGLEEEDLAIIKRVCGKKMKIISLGEDEYLTTQCITIMHWYLDNVRIL